MKQFITFFVALLFFASVSANAQEKVSFPNAAKITPSQIVMKQMWGMQVRYIEPSTLKNGQNYFILESGNKLYIEYTKGKVQKFIVAKPDGTKITEMSAMGTGEHFTCTTDFLGFRYCSCSGSADCIDLATSGNCKFTPTCTGNDCICQRK